MKFDNNQEVTDLVPDGWYEVLITEGVTDVMRDARERWRLKLEVKGVIESKQIELSLKAMGKTLKDTLIDSDKDFWKKKVNRFLKAAFPEMVEEAKKFGDDYSPPELKAEDCVGKRVGVQVSITDGNPEFDDTDKVNTCWRYKKVGEPAVEEKPVEEKADESPLI